MEATGWQKARRGHSGSKWSRMHKCNQKQNAMKLVRRQTFSKQVEIEQQPGINCIMIHLVIAIPYLMFVFTQQYTQLSFKYSVS